MTLQELIENVIMDIDEDIDDDEVVEKVTNFINRAYKELAKKEYLEKSTTLNFVDGKAKKPSDYFMSKGLYIENIPVQYEIQGYYFKADVENATLVYNYIPDSLEDLEDETVTNESNINFIISYAEYLYYRMEGLFDEMNIARNEIDNFRIVRPQITSEKIIDVYGGNYV